MKPKCKVEVYSRVTGFFRPVDSWNKGKQAEFNDRKMYKEVESWQKDNPKETVQDAA